MFMGFTPSPYHSVRFYYFAEEFVVGDPKEKDSPLRWDRVILNCPGDSKWDPRRPGVMKWDDIRKCIAGAIVTFVDDGRGSAKTCELSWQVFHRCATRLQYLGIQVALRKVRPPSQKPGAWAGSTFIVELTTIKKSITQKKWDKAKSIVLRALTTLLENEGVFDYKTLESDRGFLVHVAGTYEAINPNLKGFHLTIDSWRKNRRGDGWKMGSREWDNFLMSIEDEKERDTVRALGDADHPDFVEAVPRFKSDLEALKKFFESDTPVEVPVRSTRVAYVVYGFGDASKEGFGNSILVNDGLSVHIGIWNYSSKDQSSNFREFRNVVEGIRKEGERGTLEGCFLFFATDNSTVETALYTGTSSSELLLECVIEFRQLEMKYGFRSFVTHVAGTRMIAQGGDGLSRSDLNAGVLAGRNMLEFLPLHQGALERLPALEEWVRSWCGEDAITLTPEDWFVRGHDITGFERDPDNLFNLPIIQSGTYLWSPPPWVALTCLEELRKARIKRHRSVHIVVIPKLATPLWQKMLFKVSDVVLDLSADKPYWPPEMHEHLLIGLLFPYVRFEPWCLRGTPKMYQLRREVQRVLKDTPLAAGPLLHEFCMVSRKLPFLSRSLYDERELHEVVGDNGKKLNLWRHKSPDEKQFMEARDGDMLLTPFVCHECIFFILVGRPLNKDFHSDKLLISVLKRSILDCLWSRARSTVRLNMNRVIATLKVLQAYGLKGPYYDPGPTPEFDVCGWECAVSMLIDTLGKGTYFECHKQFDTSRHIKGTIANFEKVSFNLPETRLALVDEEKGKSQRFHMGGTSSLWYDRFTQGVKARMGQDVRKDLALSTELWIEILKYCDDRARHGTTFDDSCTWIVAGFYFAIAYVLALRGPEGFMFEISLMRQHRELNNNLVWLPIMGKLKGDDNSGVYFLRSVPITSSGINILARRNWLLTAHERAGRNAGPAICDSTGKLMKSQAMNENLWRALEHIYESSNQRKLFPAAIKEKEDIRKLIQISRSPRRSGESRALAEGVPLDDRETVCRWSKKERAKGKSPNEPLRLGYAQQSLLDKCFKRFTEAM